ncbi:hypothetical protein ASG17_09730 [Brevundimonas sp. Leaf363]|uniref:hypothetical protein n=1 Tax=Brevundimonas sp. Leaf363 TaxID=1736353 RepID=UPI0006F7A78C|nr:hypothetical protein [Brevundimonas sp. Leaf363]KQS56277.1 hypothetical protein ASG17_09730 [Brevundimonas sp. Leaf363]
MVRALTTAERVLARSVFGAAIDLEPVRLAPSPLKRAFVAGRWFARDWIVWPRGSLMDDFGNARLSDRSTLIHELVHVWQAQSGVNLLTAKLRAGDSAAAYAYALDDTCVWVGLNIEQQASLVEHAYRLREGGRTPQTADFYARTCPFPVFGLAERA